MPELREAQSIIEDAEHAAAAGNYSSAEDLLRKAASLQEQTLGPQHPDLANTLNNLGVVCEITDNPIDAEHYFRRAYAIATATLAPDHPFVATSRKNLYDFCVARGRPVELPPSPPAVAGWLDAQPRAASPRDSSPSTNKHELPAIAPKRSRRPLALAALSGIALLIVMLVITRPWGSSETASRPSEAVTPTGKTPPALSTAPPEPVARPRQTATQPPRSEGGEVSAKLTPPATSAAIPTVVTAQLCTVLKAWQCEAAELQVPPGALFFYTQLKSATDTTVEHRWYQGDRLHRSVQLRIQANPGTGYRTYSRTAISNDRAGDWRVELRSADGTLLQEMRFTVR